LAGFGFSLGELSSFVLMMSFDLDLVFSAFGGAYYFIALRVLTIN
jgi:hypothetical protein